MTFETLLPLHLISSCNDLIVQQKIIVQLPCDGANSNALIMSQNLLQNSTLSVTVVV